MASDRSKEILIQLLNSPEGREQLRKQATEGIRAGLRLRHYEGSTRQQTRVHIALLRLVRAYDEVDSPTNLVSSS